MSKARASDAARAAVRDVNERVATGPSAWAKKLLERQGWCEGKGLGKEEDGMTTHLRVKKKEDNSALGYVKPPDGAVAQDWWAVDPFKAAAGKGATSVPTTGAAVPGVPAGMDAQEFYAGLFAATGGARLGMRARRDQPGKVARAGDSAPSKVVVVEDEVDSDAEAAAESKRLRKEKKRRRREEEASALAGGDSDKDTKKYGKLKKKKGKNSV